MTVLDLSNIAAMTALTKASLTDGQQVLVGGYTSIGDGGGGTFYWHQGSSTTVNGGTVFAADEGGTGRWKRIYSGPFNVKWFGAKGDGTTNDYTALNNCFTTAVATSQIAVIAPVGTYTINQTLNVSNVSLIGDGAVGTTFKPLQPFTGDAVLLIDDTTGGSGGVLGRYERFRIDGNRSGISTTVHGLKLHGNVLHNEFSTIQIHQCKGVCLLLEGKPGGIKPSVNTFINVRMIDGDSHGVEMRAGRNNDFIECDTEGLGGRGWNITSATESVSHLGIIRPWIEAVQGDGIYLNDVGGGSIIDNPTITGYGSTGVASYGIRITGTGVLGIKVIGGGYTKNASPHASSRHIRIDGGFHINLELLGSQVSASEIEIVGDRPVTISNCWHVPIQSLIQAHFTNGRAAITAGQSRYLAPYTGGQSATYSNVRGRVIGLMAVGELRFESTVAAGGSATYTVTLYKNGSATGLTATTAPGGSTASSSAAEILFSSGDDYAVLLTSSGGAATIPVDGAHITIGVRQ